MPRIFKYGDILNITFTSDKELNILIYGSPSYLIIYRSHTLLKMVRFFWPTLYIGAVLCRIRATVINCVAFNVLIYPSI